MPEQVGQIEGEVGLSTKKLQKGVQQAEREFDALGHASDQAEKSIDELRKRVDESDKDFQKLDRAVDEMQTNFKALERRLNEVESELEQTERAGLGVADVFAGAFAADLAMAGVEQLVSGLGAAVAEMEEFGDRATEISRTSAAMDVSTGKLQELQHVFDRAGLEAEDLRDAMSVLAERSFIALKNQTGGVADDFRSLGVEMEELQDKSPAELLELVMRKMEGLDNATQRATAQEALLGGEFQKLNQIISDQDTSVQGLIESFNESGRKMDEEMIQKGVEAKRAFRDFDEEMTALKNTLSAEAAPAVAEIAERLSDVAQSFREGMKEGGKYEDFLQNIVAGVDQTIRAIAGSVEFAVRGLSSLMDVYDFGRSAGANVDLATKEALLQGARQELEQVKKGGIESDSEAQRFAELTDEVEKYQKQVVQASQREAELNTRYHTRQKFLESLNQAKDKGLNAVSDALDTVGQKAEKTDKKVAKATTIGGVTFDFDEQGNINTPQVDVSGGGGGGGGKPAPTFQLTDEMVRAQKRIERLKRDLLEASGEEKAVIEEQIALRGVALKRLKLQQRVRKGLISDQQAALRLERLKTREVKAQHEAGKKLEEIDQKKVKSLMGKVGDQAVAMMGAGMPTLPSNAPQLAARHAVDPLGDMDDVEPLGEQFFDDLQQGIRLGDELASSIANVADAGDKTTAAISGVTGSLQGAAQLGAGVAAGNPLAAVSGGVGILGSVFNAIARGRQSREAKDISSPDVQNQFADVLADKLGKVMEQRLRDIQFQTIDARGALVGTPQEVGNKILELGSEASKNFEGLNFG